MPGREAARRRVSGSGRLSVAPSFRLGGFMVKHLLIGGGPAAINAIETIRDFDGGASQITLVSDEPAYSRMVLPYWLANKIPEKQVFTADDAYYDALKVEQTSGQKV